jgi:hypothetical protein
MRWPAPSSCCPAPRFCSWGFDPHFSQVFLRQHFKASFPQRKGADFVAACCRGGISRSPLSGFSPDAGFPVSPLLVFGLGQNRGDVYRLSVLVQRDESKIGGSRVPDFAGHEILRFHPHADFHGSIAGVVYRSQQPEKIADIHGRVEVDAVDRYGDDIGVCVAAGDDTGGIIDILQYDPAVNVPCQVRVLMRHLVNNGYGTVFYPFCTHNSALALTIVYARRVQAQKKFILLGTDYRRFEVRGSDAVNRGSIRVQ